MNTDDLTSKRNAANLRKLEMARRARDGLETERQLTVANDVLSLVGKPRTEAEQLAAADALEFAVDALCNRGQTSEARQLAEDTQALVRNLAEGPGKLISRPGSLPDYRIDRVLAGAIELDGDPEDAMSRLMALHTLLLRDVTLGSTPIDQLTILRGVISAAKREGSVTGTRFADLARRHGDRIVDDVAMFLPEVAASYLHRAGIELRARPGAQARQEALERLEHSLPLRPVSHRNRRSRGMATGEIVVLRGDPQRGGRIMTETTLGFEDVLPRKFESARTQLVDRGLFMAA